MRSSAFCRPSRVRAIPSRMRRSAGDASSPISPLGRMALRMAAARKRKSASERARSVSSGNFEEASRKSFAQRRR